MLLALAALAALPIEAGFPCRNAASPQERLVCARPELAAADVEINRNYRNALAQLGREGRRQLRLSQRAWIRFRDAICPTDRSGYPDGRTPETCLEARYVQRDSDLREAVRPIGPFRVVRLDGYRVWPAPGRTGWYDDVLTHEERVDWIEIGTLARREAAAAARWNAMLSRRSAMRGRRWLHSPRARDENDPDSYGGETQSGRDAEIVAASTDVIVGRTENYWTGGAHPWEVVEYETLLVPERRRLRLADLVARPQDFRRAAYRRLAVTYADVDFSGFGHVPDIALSPRSWEPTNAGLVIHYGTIFGRPFGDLTATLGWREMAPFLSGRGRRIAASFRDRAPARAE